MKKILLSILLIFTICLTGCGKKGESYVLDELTKKIDKAKSYYAEGQMELMNNEDIYTYDVKVSYKEGDYYKVELTNTANNHEQVILRNDEGVYVVTPSLNKSFKFQSDWPYNNSQAYLLTSLLDDINNDENKTFEETKDGYIYTVAVNYPNNQKLVKQKIYIDKDININKVEVLDTNDNVQIKMNFDNIDLKSEFKDDYFDLDTLITEKQGSNNVENNNTNNNTNNDNNSNTNNNSNTDNSNTEKTKETATIEDIIYPMYLPTNTYLTNQEKVDKEDGQRLILTFDGDSSFMLIEETVSMPDEHQIIPTYGDLELLSDTIAVVNDNSVNWISNGIEYYVISDVMAKNELLEVARSISVIPVSAGK